jgi:hypothetical protein
MASPKLCTLSKFLKTIVAFGKPSGSLVLQNTNYSVRAGRPKRSGVIVLRFDFEAQMLKIFISKLLRLCMLRRYPPNPRKR